jgi:hypothetical protein
VLEDESGQEKFFLFGEPYLLYASILDKKKPIFMTSEFCPKRFDKK